MYFCVARSAGASLRRHNEAALEQVIYYKHDFTTLVYILGNTRPCFQMV